MKTYILNIGMARNDGPPNTKGALYNALRLADLLPMDTSFHNSDTEETAVLQFEDRPTYAQVKQLCDLLGQECIAMLLIHDGEGTGMLIGPKAELWGPFNPELFLMPDGARYSTLIPQP